jgi:tRNA(fMet)-specific endonuclease VapC
LPAIDRNALLRYNESSAGFTLLIRNPAQNAAALRRFCVGIEIRPFDSHAASVYGRVRAELVLLGTPIGPLDTLIAAHAIALDALLITSNVKEFQRVRGLRWEPGILDTKDEIETKRKL